MKSSLYRLRLDFSLYNNNYDFLYVFSNILSLSNLQVLTYGIFDQIKGLLAESLSGKNNTWNNMWRSFCIIL